MKKIRLWGMSGANLIYPTTSGVIITNQVGGGACLQPQLEGVVIPLKQSYHHHSWLSDLEIELYKIFEHCGSITHAMADDFDNLMQANVETSVIKINRDRLIDSCEAWIYVAVHETPLTDFVGFDSFLGVLTWNNSD